MDETLKNKSEGLLRTNNIQALRTDELQEVQTVSQIEKQDEDETQLGNHDYFATGKFMKEEKVGVREGDDDNELLDMLAILAKDVKNHNYEQAIIFDQLLNEFIKDA